MTFDDPKATAFLISLSEWRTMDVNPIGERSREALILGASALSVLVSLSAVPLLRTTIEELIEEGINSIKSKQQTAKANVVVCCAPILERKRKGEKKKREVSSMRKP